MPIPRDILHKIRQIEIHTRRLLRNSLVGDSRSAIKGTGFEFDQIRNYQYADDVRFIDWNASARMNTLLVKQYIEERSRIIILAVDISGSTGLGSHAALKKETIAQIASVLALVGTIGKDRVGLMLFSHDVELYIPPARGSHHAHLLMNHLFDFKPACSTTNITAALTRLAQLTYKDALIFLISDFIDETINTSCLAYVARQHDLVAIRCLDTQEQAFPNVGFLEIKDIETGESAIFDTRLSSKQIHSFLHDRIEQQNTLLRRYGVSLITVANNDSFMGTLIRFFRQRMRY